MSKSRTLRRLIRFERGDRWAPLTIPVELFDDKKQKKPFMVVRKKPKKIFTTKLTRRTYLIQNSSLWELLLHLKSHSAKHPSLEPETRRSATSKELELYWWKISISRPGRENWKKQTRICWMWTHRFHCSCVSFKDSSTLILLNIPYFNLHPNESWSHNVFLN